LGYDLGVCGAFPAYSVDDRQCWT